MRIHDDQLARDSRLRRPAPARRDDRAAGPARPNERPNVQALDETAILNLQRFAGNAAVTDLLSDGSAQPARSAKKEEVGAPKPHLDLAAFGFGNAARTFGAFPDKTAEEKEGEFDQEVDVGTFAAADRGLRIVAEISGGFDSTDYPDGFKFTQVIDTNAPLHGATAPYVDPHPNDDTKPFYWTDAEQERYPTTFRDYPKRNPPTGTSVTYWQATLALNGVDDKTKKVTGFDYITYGFQMDAAGNITLSYPQSTDGENHRRALTTEFSGWTFD